MSAAKLDHALEVAAHGLPVFPCKGKRPAVKGWQSQATTDGREIIKLWERRSSANIGVAMRGLVVLDTDHPEAEEWVRGELALPATATTQTRRGRHRYFKAKVPKGCLPEIRPGVEVKGNRGGYPTGQVLAPGSVIAGHVYRWAIHPEEVGIAKAPDELIRMIQKTEIREIVTSEQPIPDGLRNVVLASIGGRLHHHYRLHDAADLIPVLAGINERRCRPPLPENEVRKIAESVARYGIRPWQRSPFEVARWCADPRLKTTSRYVLWLACAHADHFGAWDLSRNQMARLTGRSVADIKRAVQELQAKDRIKVEPRHAKSGRSLSSRKVLLSWDNGREGVKEGVHTDPLPPKTENGGSR